MIGNFLQLTPTQLETLIANPADVESFIYPDDEENENCIDIDKAWHDIHFMLTGEQYEGDPPLSNVIFSSAVIGDDVGYGPARYLTAAEVAEVAAALRALPNPVRHDCCRYMSWRQRDAELRMNCEQHRAGEVSRRLCSRKSAQR